MSFARCHVHLQKRQSGLPRVHAAGFSGYFSSSFDLSCSWLLVGCTWWCTFLDVLSFLFLLNGLIWCGSGFVFNVFLACLPLHGCAQLYNRWLAFVRCLCLPFSWRSHCFSLSLSFILIILDVCIWWCLSLTHLLCLYLVFFNRRHLFMEFFTCRFASPYKLPGGLKSVFGTSKNVFQATH